MKKSKFVYLMLLFLLIVFSITAIPVFAYSGSTETTETQYDEYKIITDSPFELDKKEFDEVEIRYPNKLESNKIIDSQNVESNKGIATLPSEARANVEENVSNANKDYPIHHGSVVKGKTGKKTNKSKENTFDKYSADARQFVTFQTKNGKKFYLIINHDETEDNVILLTEASEDDLLNMTGKQTQEEKGLFDKPFKQEENITSQISNAEDEEIDKDKTEKKGNGEFIFYGIVMIVVFGIAYYFKVYKKREEDDVANLEEGDEEMEEEDDDSYFEDNDVEGKDTSELF